TEVQCKPAACFPVVLDEEVVIPVAHVDFGGAVGDSDAVRSAEQEIRERDSGVLAIKPELALPGVPAGLLLGITDFGSVLEHVLSMRVRQRVIEQETGNLVFIVVTGIAVPKQSRHTDSGEAERIADRLNTDRPGIDRIGTGEA